MERALAQDKREGLRLAVRARWIALGVIAVFLPFLNPSWQVLYYEILLAGFALIGWVQLKIGRVGRSRAELLLILSDLGLMAFVLVVPPPFSAFEWPVAMQYHFDNFAYFYVLLASATLAYSWRTISAMGVWTSLIWLFGLAWVLLQPVAHPELSEAVKAALNGNLKLLEFLDPNHVNIAARIQEIVIFLIVANILALGSWRTNRLLLKQVAAERERANLARYFPPNIVDQLADRDQPFGAVRTQPVAVMFADIVGFTRIAESQSPGQVVAMLREFHARMENAVFDNGGTLDKFLGDGLMATFGTPDPSPQDGANAVRCARAMQAAMDDWNGERSAHGVDPVRLSIGVHYGEVVLGEVGSERRLEFTVLGDVVNVASRLEGLTRTLATKIIISDALVKTVHAETGPAAETLLAGFTPGEQRSLRGRNNTIGVWTIGTDP